MHSRWAFQWRRKEKSVKYGWIRLPESFLLMVQIRCLCTCVFFPTVAITSSHQLTYLMQLLWTNCLWTSPTFFPFYRPKSSALNNVWIHQPQLKNMSRMSQQSTGKKMSNWTEEVMCNSCRVGLFNELSQAQKRGCFLCSTHFGSKLTNHGRAAELSILFS